MLRFQNVHHERKVRLQPQFLVKTPYKHFKIKNTWKKTSSHLYELKQPVLGQISSVSTSVSPGKHHIYAQIEQMKETYQSPFCSCGDVDLSLVFLSCYATEEHFSSDWTVIRTCPWGHCAATGTTSPSDHHLMWEPPILFCSCHLGAATLLLVLSASRKVGRACTTQVGSCVLKREKSWLSSGG